MVVLTTEDLSGRKEEGLHGKTQECYLVVLIIFTF